MLFLSWEIPFRNFLLPLPRGGGRGGSRALSLDLGNNMDTNRKALDSYLVWSPEIWEVWVIGLGFMYGRDFLPGERFKIRGLGFC